MGLDAPQQRLYSAECVEGLFSNFSCIECLGGNDGLMGGDGNDVIYGGPGGDGLLGGKGNDVIYGGDGNDLLWSKDGDRDKVYGGEGKDECFFDKLDYVDSSCEKKSTHMPQQ